MNMEVELGEHIEFTLDDNERNVHATVTINPELLSYVQQLKWAFEYIVKACDVRDNTEERFVVGFIPGSRDQVFYSEDHGMTVIMLTRPINTLTSNVVSYNAMSMAYDKNNKQFDLTDEQVEEEFSGVERILH